MVPTQPFWHTDAAEWGRPPHRLRWSLTLVEEIAGQSRLPVVASGGIATGEGLVAVLALGAQGVQIGTAFLATTESFAHGYHKQRIVDAVAGDTTLTDIFVLNWPAHAAVRVIGNSVTAELGFSMLGHDPEELPRVVIAFEDQRSIYRYSTDSPLRITSGDLEAMALFAGQGVSAIKDIIPAAERLRRIVVDAETCLIRLVQYRTVKEVQP
jgi:nitronate monooxygenase